MQDRERQRKLEELFQIAVTISGAELPAFFARHCAGDDELRLDLESLLAHDEDTRDYLQSPVPPSPVELPGSSDSPEDSTRFLRHSIPERVGRYHILGKIGAGGMGSVYLAEQQKPVRRRVALKIVRVEMDGGRVLERFEHERQTLAMMDHPGIAMILDVGTTNTNRPFFVMEYVPGDSITRSSDEQRITLNDRLMLLAKVCDAVQHAHQKGIVHRDIKPSNVIVTFREGVPEPKVIDFGIACAVGRHRTTSKDGGAALLGTLHYMAPEQVDAESFDVDTRVDVFSLGVLAYELLVGVLPFSATQLRREGHDDIRRALLEQVAPSPSARAAALAPERGAELASLRGLSRRRWIRALSGDLDAIVARAMAKERGERYASASELAADLRRFLALEPVSAGRATWTGRISRYVRRHRVGVVSGLLIGAALLTAIVGLSWGVKEARANELLAMQAVGHLQHERRSAERDRLVAQRELREADAVRRFLLEAITLTDSHVASSPNGSPDPILSLASERVGEAFSGDPEGEAELRHALGSAFHSIGQSDLAELHLERALEIRGGSLTISLDELFTTTRLLARVYGESDSRENSALLRRACLLAIEMVAAADPDLAVELTRLLDADSSPDDAQDVLQRLASQRQRVEQRTGASAALASAERLAIADVWEFVGVELATRQGSCAGIDFVEAALELRNAELLPRDFELAETRGLLAELLLDRGEFARAEELALASIAGHEQAHARGHFRVQLALSRLGSALVGLGRPGEARCILEEAHSVVMESCGQRSPAAALVCARLVSALDHAGLTEEADIHRLELRQTLALVRNAPVRWNDRRVAFGPEHEALVEVLDQLPGANPEQLHAIASRALELRRANLSADDPLAAIVARELFGALADELHTAPELFRDVCLEVVEVLGPRAQELPETLSASLWGLARTCESEEQCEAHLRRGLVLLREAFGPIDRSVLFLESRLAESLGRQGRHGEIESGLVDSWLACVEELGLSHEISALALSTLRNHFDSKSTPGEFSPYLRKHLEGQVAEDVNPARLRTWTWYAVRTPHMDPEVVELALDASRRADFLSGRRTWHRAAVFFRQGRRADALLAVGRVTGELSARGHAIHALIAADAGRVEESKRALESAEAALESLDAPPHADLAPLLAEVRESLQAGTPRRFGSTSATGLTPSDDEPSGP